MMRILNRKHPLKYFRLVCNTKSNHILFPNAVCYFATTIDIDSFTYDFLERYKSKQRNSITDINSFSIRRFMDHGSNVMDIKNMTEQVLHEFVMKLLTRNKDSQIGRLIIYCRDNRKLLGDNCVKRLLRHYSLAGKPEMIINLQHYCLKVDPNTYRRSGKFMHFLAKAQCFKGNSEKGLSILTESYENNVSMRSFYRIIFRELIQDAVLNKSEASMVIFKKYALNFSEVWNDHYPLICFWHLCWSSSWFSDQVLADELLETSEALRDIVRDKATAFSITALKEDYNEDAVTRLLQALLKYKFMTEYVKVLQVLFNFKLRIRDIRGCTEIMRNCEVLGLALPSDQQGRYIKMLIHGESGKQTAKPTDETTKNFKLKF
ncbi:unnamed protein product [Chilo suppressalis]|uniref:Uncharacterized protein n=1 Tax=Chilo suppressalis TaxID=168631 RepID=A0ABN8EAD5_CHISP|nr:unnamed protein product [Chilo suppressalis]